MELLKLAAPVLSNHQAVPDFTRLLSGASIRLIGAMARVEMPGAPVIPKADPPAPQKKSRRTVDYAGAESIERHYFTVDTCVPRAR